MKIPNIIKCLDHGYVKLIDYMPKDVNPETRIAQCARISFDNFNQEHSLKEDQALVRYLYENHHTSPLEMVEVLLEIHCPQFVATHFHRHRTASINEISQRYKEIPDEFYSPDVRRQAITNKQGSIPDDELADSMSDKINTMNTQVNDLLKGYHELIQAGVAKEVARAYLPRSMYTTMVYKMDANNLLKLLSLRCAPDAQKETQVYAQAMKELVTPLIPTLIQCLDERLNSVLLRPDEINAMASGLTTLNSSVRRNKEYQSKLHKLRPKKLFVLVGYRRTGKDTLAKALVEGTPISDLYWTSCFKVPSCINGKRLALADAVKAEVLELYPCLKQIDNLEAIKDQALDILDGKSPRDLWKQHAMKQRSLDPDYWIHKVMQVIEVNTEHDIVITDCRFRNEIEAFKQLKYQVITIRIVRDIVPIPDPTDITEHELDEIKTDYLLVDTISSLNLALDLFPQYTR